MGLNRRWCDDVEPVTMTTTCGGEDHTITWRRGKLVLEDHPGLVAEEVLAALSGEPATCLRILQVWREGRFPADSDAGLWEKARMAAIVGWLRRWDDEPFRRERWSRMVGTLRGEAMPYLIESMKVWRIRLGLGGPWRRHAVVRATDGRPWVDGVLRPREGDVAVSLPVTWLRDVWMRGLTFVDGSFVVAGGDQRVEAIRWEEQRGGFRPVVASAAVAATTSGRPALRWL